MDRQAPEPAETEAPPGKRLTARQRRALGVVLAAPTLTEGCVLAGIGRTTWWAWQKTSAPFRRALRDAEDSMVREAHARLKLTALRAQEKLATLMESFNEGIALQAAVCVLRFSREVVAHDLVERVEALEAEKGGTR